MSHLVGIISRCLWVRNCEGLGGDIRRHAHLSDDGTPLGTTDAKICTARGSYGPSTKTGGSSVDKTCKEQYEDAHNKTMDFHNEQEYCRYKTKRCW